MFLDARIQRRLVAHLLARAGVAPSRDHRRAFLQAAHIAGQSRLEPHLRVHAVMLRHAGAEHDLREVGAQLLRLVLTPLGHLGGRLPWGNPGTGDVHPLHPMAVRPEIETLIREGLLALEPQSGGGVGEEDRSDVEKQ